MTKVANRITKVLVCVMALITLLVSVTSVKASASWYGWTYATFSVAVNGAARYYDGNNVGLNWSGDTHNSNPNHSNNGGGFTITLQRKNAWGGWTTIGSYRADRNRGGGATWSNVGSGTYRFRFTKANDGTTEYVRGIEMFSW